MPFLRRNATYVALTLAMLASACGGGSSPSAPTSPSPGSSATLAITGATTLATIGQTSQLTATLTANDGTKTDVTATAGWQSASPLAISVSSSGLITANGLGAVAISASYQGRTAQLAVSVTAGSGPIAACGSYSGGGPYTLAGDLTSTSTVCVRITNAGSGSLDCLGRDAQSLNLSGAQGFTLRDCKLHGAVPDSSNRLLNLQISSSSQLVVDAVDALGQVIVQTCTRCTFSHNTFVYPKVGFVLANGFVSCELCFTGGSDTQVIGNAIDGGYDGSFATYQRQGVDDGILLNREVNLTIQDNVIRNAFDAGIEPGTSNGPITITIRDNRISNMGYTGFGSYYVEGFRQSIFSGNTVSNSPNFASFSASAASGVTTATLVDNVFENNTFVSPIQLPPTYGLGVPASVVIVMIGRGTQTVSGNVFRNNLFGTASGGPILNPSTGFIDGGGNVCSTSTVLNCAGGTDTATRFFARPAGVQPISRF